MTSKGNPSLNGWYDVCFSPDEAAETCKGFWVHLWNDDIKKERTSDECFRTAEQAHAWAKRNGGKRHLKAGAA